MVLSKAKRIYTAYNFYEKEKLYQKSSHISLFIMTFILIAAICMHIILNMTKIVEIPKTYTNIENEEVKEIYKNNEIKNSRKILADYSNFIIYSAPAVKKEEIKKEIPVEKKQADIPKKKVEKKPLQKPEKKQTPAIETAKPVQNETAGTVVSNNADFKNEIAAKIVYQMERYKKYPKQARRINAEGIAKVTFSVNASGVVSSVDITDSSGYSILDNAALKAAEKIIGSQVISNEAYNNLLQVTVPVDFYLN